MYQHDKIPMKGGVYHKLRGWRIGDGGGWKGGKPILLGPKEDLLQFNIFSFYVRPRSRQTHQDFCFTLGHAHVKLTKISVLR